MEDKDNDPIRQIVYHVLAVRWAIDNKVWLNSKDELHRYIHIHSFNEYLRKHFNDTYEEFKNRF